MAARTIRVLWENQGTGWVNFNWNAINGNSVVHVAACEGRLDRSVGNILTGLTRIRGAAPIFVKNVHPHDDNGGGVELYIEVDWGSPLTVITDITVIDTPEQGFVAN